MAHHATVYELSAYRAATAAIAYIRRVIIRGDPPWLSGCTVELNQAGVARLVIWMSVEDALMRRCLPTAVDNLRVDVRVGACPRSRLKLTSGGHRDEGPLRCPESP
jgi:hypothetical protein